MKIRDFLCLMLYRQHYIQKYTISTCIIFKHHTLYKYLCVYDTYTHIIVRQHKIHVNMINNSLLCFLTNNMKKKNSNK